MGRRNRPQPSTTDRQQTPRDRSQRPGARPPNRKTEKGVTVTYTILMQAVAR